MGEAKWVGLGNGWFKGRGWKMGVEGERVGEIRGWETGSVEDWIGGNETKLTHTLGNLLITLQYNFFLTRNSICPVSNI